MTAQELVNKLQLNGSYDGIAILALSQKRVDQLLDRFDPDEDALIHISSVGFSINHGNVGSRGINYEFEVS
jgi:hypothetical protein